MAKEKTLCCWQCFHSSPSKNNNNKSPLEVLTVAPVVGAGTDAAARSFLVIFNSPAIEPCTAYWPRPFLWPLRQLIPVFVSRHVAYLLALASSSSFRLLRLSQSSSSCSLATSDSSSDSSVQRQHRSLSRMMRQQQNSEWKSPPSFWAWWWGRCPPTIHHHHCGTTFDELRNLEQSDPTASARDHSRAPQSLRTCTTRHHHHHDSDHHRHSF